MKLFDLVVIITLFTLVSSKEATFPGEVKVIEHLTKKLTRKECWVVCNYLAQKAPKPVQAQTKMVKTAGHPRDFDCQAGLKLWASSILPPMLVKVEQKERFAKKQLKQALGLARRKDLRDWLQNYDITTGSEGDESLVITKIVTVITTEAPAPLEKTTGIPEYLAVSLAVVQLVEPPPVEKVAEPMENNAVEADDAVDSTLLASKAKGQNVVVKEKNARAKGFGTHVESTTQTPDSVGKQLDYFRQVIKYVVISVIGVVSLCLVVAIACSCRRRGRENAGDDEEGQDPEVPSATVSGLGDTGITGQEDKYLNKDYTTARPAGHSVTVTVENGDNVNANPLIYKATTKRI